MSPENQEVSPEYQSLIRQLTNAAEKGAPLSDELNAMPFPQRLAVAVDIANLAARDKTADGGLPNIVLSTAVDNTGQTHLTDIACLGANNSRRDIYNLPGRIDQQNVTEQVKLGLDRYHSMFLANGGREIFRR